MISKVISFHMTLSIVLFLFFQLTPCHSLRPYAPYQFSHHSKGNNKGSQSHMHTKEDEIGMELFPMGSSLSDCSYACGRCASCRRVLVSFMTCSVESCPVVYRCQCRGKYFHVPSN